ncbi:MAG: response regulator [Pirellulaceae bacterium]|nr:response regulator [Pirellulaceae bacterium]
MLVLSGKEQQRVAFPNFGMTVEFLRVEGSRVRVGFDAPSHIGIQRGEQVEQMDLAGDRQLAGDLDDFGGTESNRKRNYDFRNRLNTANIAMNVLQKQLVAGLVDDAAATFSDALKMFSDVDHVVCNRFPVSAAKEKESDDRRALVVEGNANERELLAGYLRMCGYVVDTVQDGIDAMLYLANRSQRPDVVLLDMQVPRMDGANTVRAIRSNPAYQDIRIFAVSGLNRALTRVEIGHDGGVDGWLFESLEPAAFADEIDRCCPTV